MLEKGYQLAEKINTMIQEIEEYDGLVLTKKSQIRRCLQEINSMVDKQIFSVPNEILVDGKQSEIFHFMQDFFQVVGRIKTDEAFVKYTYESKYSPFYYKVEQSVFEEYISKYVYMEQERFLSYCVDFEMVKAEKNRRCIYGSGDIRVYYVKKCFVDTITRGLMEEQGG